MHRSNSLVERLLRGLADPANSGPVLAMAVMIYYGLVTFVNEDFAGVPEQQLVAGLAMVAGISILVGWSLMSRLAPADRLPSRSVARTLIGIAVLFFSAFVAVTALTAPSLPLFSALAGEDPADIALAREQFLKAREGALLALVYLNAALTFTLVPYAMCLGFIRKERSAWLLLALFLGYSVLFLEKAFFLRVLAPLAALIVVTRNHRVRLSWLLLAAFALLVLNVALSGFADERGITGFLLYRVLDIPARTAIDTLVYWQDTWGGKYLSGATNLVFSQLFSLERIHLERLVFEYQFGPYESGTASANAVFFVDAFVNFGWLGVLVTSAALGVILAHVGRSKDLALRCLAPLIMYSVFSASLYPVLFGNALLAFLVVRYLWAGVWPSADERLSVPSARNRAKRLQGGLQCFAIPLLAAAIMIACSEAAAATESRTVRVPLPEGVAMDIALRTLPASETPFTGRAQERAAQVRAFVESMGGEAWFGGYQERFGPPSTIEEYKVANLSNVFGTDLGHYYLHSRPVSTHALTVLSCNTPDPDNRTSLAFCALGYWDSMLAFGDANSRKQFLLRADKLLREQTDGRWDWASDLPSRNLKAPWISGLTQSLGVSVLLRAYQLVGDDAYRAAATAAFRWLAVPISEGGVMAPVASGSWFEEYPNAAAPSHVLNGHMWALFGIWDYFRVTESSEAKDLFESGIRALEGNLRFYDVSGWSVYSRDNEVDFVTGAYQQFIVEQLRVLETISGSKLLAAYRSLWECSLQQDGLFVHLAANEFSKAQGLSAPRRDYPRNCEELAYALLAIGKVEPGVAEPLRRTPRAVVKRAAADSKERIPKVDQVLEWLPSMGGNQWFANYVAQFGRPITRCVFEFSRSDVFESKLKRYYLGHPIRAGRPMTDPDCIVDLVGTYGIADRNTTTMVAHLALANWDAYIATGDPVYRDRFLRHTVTLRERQTHGRWNWLIEVPSRDLKAPWISAMTQSLGVSVFLRAYQLTGEADYLERASAAMQWIGRSLSESGVASPASVGNWYEEYPNASRPSHVLNGHIWALFGIWDYFRVTNDANARRMFGEGIEALKAEIERYDLGYWIVYDQLNRVDVVNGFYVSFIVEQLKALFAITGDRMFQRLAMKWEGYQSNHALFGHMAFTEFEKAQRPGK